mmetsp:Transcript_18676/g.60380  ORF Transcript_18676/g.60380 Transcript_18676/m.60380 type:complete len:881 (-) Transcript_18676:1194-3836(-)
MVAMMMVMPLLLVSLARAQSNRVAKAMGPPSFFLQDAQSDGHCLGDGLFKRCGIDTLWYVSGKPGSYSLHRRKIDEEDDDLCLDKASCFLDESALRLGHCKHCGALKWNIVGDSDQGYALTEDNGKYCLKRVGNKAKTSLCERKEHVALNLQFAQRDEIRAMESVAARFVAAASEGDEKAVKAFLENDEVADVNARDWDNLTALVAASAGGHKKLCQFLLQKGADVYAKDKDNITALMEAAIGGHRDVAEFLLKEAPDLLEQKAASGVSALWLAASEGQLKVAEILIKLDADVSNARSDGITALMAASSGGHTEVAELLVNAGADVDAKDDEGLTALMNAAENGTASTVKLLATHGAQPDATSSAGFTPLIVAAAGGHTEACAALLDFGANVSADHAEGVDALMYAAAGGHLETVKLLLDKGADPKKQHAHGGSAFVEAATFGAVDVVKLLAEKGAEPLLHDKEGVNALMAAASQGKVDATRYLLDEYFTSKELFDVAADSGGTALMFAAAGGHLECTKMLIEKGGDVNKRVKGTPSYVESVAQQIASGKEDVEPHKDDVTALQVAAQGGHAEVVKLLLEHGADVSIADEEGATALTNAVSNDKPDVAFLLVDAGANPDDSYVDSNARERKLLPDAVGANNDKFAELLVRKGATCSNSLFLQAAHRGLNLTVPRMLATTTESCLVDPAFANSEAVTALIAASSEGHVEVVKAVVNALLLNEGTKEHLDDADKDGTTSLMAAAVRGHAPVVNFLLASGADVNKQNKEGHTALMFAYNGRAQVMALYDKYVAVLEEKKKTHAKSAETSSQQKDDSNLDIINAALASHTAIVDNLLQKGADPDLTDSQGNKAIDFDYVKQDPPPPPPPKDDKDGPPEPAGAEL